MHSVSKKPDAYDITMGARRHGQDGALAVPWKMYKTRFASVTTSCFPQKQPKSLPQRFKIYLNCDCSWGSAPDPTEVAYSAPQTLSCI